MENDQPFPPPPPHEYHRDYHEVAERMSVAALTAGILAVFFFWVFAIPTALAIVFGAVAIGKQKRAGVPLNGMAVVGLILGILSAIGFVVTLILVHS